MPVTDKAKKDYHKSYPMLRVRVTREQYDKAYRTGWPQSVKDFINQQPEPKEPNGKETNDSNSPANQ